jgi:hypothetical protein
MVLVLVCVVDDPLSHVETLGAFSQRPETVLKMSICLVNGHVLFSRHE